jgi:hypothetical protein
MTPTPDTAPAKDQPDQDPAEGSREVIERQLKEADEKPGGSNNKDQPKGG